MTINFYKPHPLAKRHEAMEDFITWLANVDDIGKDQPIMFNINDILKMSRKLCAMERTALIPEQRNDDA